LPPLADLPVWIGCDLSATTDWSSIAALYKQGETFYCKWYNFVPRSAIDKREKMNLKDWHTFAFDKSLTILDGNCIEQDLILETIQRIPGKVQSIVFDQWGALAIQQALIKKGYTVFRHPQSAPYFHEPCKRFEELVGKRQFIHEGGEANRYAINNCYLQQDSKGLCKPAKSSDYVKIDPAIAMLMALWQGVLGTETKTSIYEKHGIEHI
jgi:phage terminase large subunit-like protein